MTLCFVVSDDSAEFNQVNVALLSIFKIEAKGQTQLQHMPYRYLHLKKVLIPSR